MESSFKKAKVNDDVHNMSESLPLDRLSGLPDSILVQILSSIPTKYVVQMSVFSRRWRYLWTFMPTLDLNDELFVPYPVYRYSVESLKFVGFVYKVLLFHDTSNIQRFCLSLKRYDIYLSSWIDIVVRKNVQELYITISNASQIIKLPDCLFTCKSLVSLELNRHFSLLRLPTSICFTRLRTLHLDSIRFPENDLFGKVLPSCHALEILIMDGCQWDEQPVDLFSTTIRKLFINNFVDSEGIFKISIPNLISLKYIDISVKDFHFVENPLSLVDATIRIQNRSDYKTIKLLREISSARCLTLCDFTLEKLSDAPKMFASYPTFHNLNKLILTGARTNHFLVIACLLRISPKIEFLVIDIKPYSDIQFYEQKHQESKELFLLDLLLDHLKVVEIRCFEGTESELEFVKLLLRNASTMERLIITISGRELNKTTEIGEKLMMFKRASKSCIFSLS